MRELLLQNGVELQERDFFKEPFTEGELRQLAAEAGLEQLFSRRSPSLKALGLDGQPLTEAQMLELMQKEPRLIRRPIVRLGSKLLPGASVKAVAAALAEADQ